MVIIILNFKKWIQESLEDREMKNTVGTIKLEALCKQNSTLVFVSAIFTLKYYWSYPAKKIGLELSEGWPAQELGQGMFSKSRLGFVMLKSQALP